MNSTPTGPWLSVVGLGEDGWDGLSAPARSLVQRAELLVGGTRHLDLVPAQPGQQRMAWPSPLHDGFPAILAKRGRPVCVLGSGDPSWFGIGATLTRIVPPHEMHVLPGRSAFSLAAAFLGWPLQDVACLSLHGRPLELAIPHIQPGARLLALSWDGATPAKLAALLTARGFGQSPVAALEHLGGPDQAYAEATADSWGDERVADLNTIAVTCIPGPGARVVPRAPGLPDDWFQHDGQITKREVRAVTLSFLEPRKGGLLWDVGAGSGSVGIEWMLADPANHAIAIEAREDRAVRLAANAAALGVPWLEPVIGKAPSVLANLPPPDAVFIGGGLTHAGLFETCWSALKPGGRLVANAVTLESEAVLTTLSQRFGGELTRLAISRAEPVGRFRGWRSLMPVTLWAVSKS